MPESAWESPIVRCAGCQTPGCTYRARLDSRFCCKRCEAAGASSSSSGGSAAASGHEASCGRLEEATLRASWWETFRCDRAYEEDCACLVVPPAQGDGLAEPAPVLLFLTGNGHVDDRQDFLWGGPDTLLLNPLVRRHFWLLSPKPTTASGLVRYRRTGDGWARGWSEDALWSLFTEVFRRLGPAKVDPTRVYVTGLSLGAAATWHLALRFGQHLAAVAPISGHCIWPDDTWPKMSGPNATVLARLQQLPMRAYQIENDFRAGHPLKDMEWLCWGLEARERQLVLPGVEVGTAIEVKVVEWHRKETGADWEYWAAKGPLMDSSEWKDWGGDTHCLWNRVFPFPEWDLAQFFLKHRVPEERAWRFTDPPLVVDSTEEKMVQEAEWEADRDAKRSRQQEELAASTDEPAPTPTADPRTESRATLVGEAAQEAPAL